MSRVTRPATIPIIVVGARNWRTGSRLAMQRAVPAPTKTVQAMPDARNRSGVVYSPLRVARCVCPMSVTRTSNKAASMANTAMKGAVGCRIAATTFTEMRASAPMITGTADTKNPDMKRRRTSSGTSLPASVSQRSDLLLGIVQRGNASSMRQTVDRHAGC